MNREQFKSPEAIGAFELEARIKERSEDGNLIGGILYEVDTDPETGASRPYVYIANPYEERPLVTKLETTATPEEVAEIKRTIIPFPEAYKMLSTIATAYDRKQPLLIEGPTSIGKTYLVDKFTQLLHGTDSVPLDFYCSSQTDVSELTTKWVPNTEPNGGNWKLQFGAIPQAMGRIEHLDGSVEQVGVYNDGHILHIQEVGLAEPSVLNALLQLRGYNGQLAEKIQLWNDAGRRVTAGKDFWVVMSTNPPEEYLERNEIDPALARGVVYTREPELSQDSLTMAAQHYLKNSEPTETDMKNGFIAIADHPELVDELATALSAFHSTYDAALENGEKGRRQRIPSTLADIGRLAGYLQHCQVFSPENGVIDLAETLKQGVTLYYLNRLNDTELQTTLRSSLSQILDGQINAKDVDGEPLTLSQRLEAQAREISTPDEVKIEKKLGIFDDDLTKVKELLRGSEFDLDDNTMEALRELSELQKVDRETIDLDMTDQLLKRSSQVIDLLSGSSEGRNNKSNNAETVTFPAGIAGFTCNSKGEILVHAGSGITRIDFNDLAHPKILPDMSEQTRDVGQIVAKGNRLALITNHSVQLFDTQSQRSINVVDFNEINSVAFLSEAGEDLVIVGEESEICIWDAYGDRVSTIDTWGKHNRTEFIAVSSNGDKAVALNNGNAFIYSLEERKHIANIQSDDITAVAILEDDKIVVGHGDGSIETVNIKGYNLQNKLFSSENSSVVKVLESADNTHVAILHEGNEYVTLLDAGTLKKIRQIKSPDNTTITDFQYAPNNRLVMVHDNSGKLSVV